MHQAIASLRKALSQPAFLVVAVILFVAGAGLNGATSYMKLSFRKLAVPPARPLAEVPAQLGPWVQVSVDSALQHEMLEALATDKYVFRDYVDSRLISSAEIEQLKSRKGQEYAEQIAAMRQRQPAAVINLGLTYYTGLVDTVAHIPDRCYIADGFEPTQYDVEPWDCLKGRPGDEKLRYIVFEDSTPGRAAIRRNVAYFFHCNGKYFNDPIGGVRKALATLSERYGYYMKIEVQTLQLPPDDAKRVMNDFLVNLLPESEKCLPDWEQVKSLH